ncbi:transketolase [Candidatus Pacearchaeota archaeon]|nr:transketolase [Candidatus Pacearchaeota archaeon]
MKTYLEKQANEIRRRTITSIYDAQSGHPGPSFSWADIASTLFFEVMNLDGPERDRFILSKGHGVPTLYAALSLRGDLPEEYLRTLREIDSPLQGHPVKGTLDLVDATTGSLGQGLSVGLGYDLTNKLKGNGANVYVVLGDGECQEGQVWEAAMSASKFAREGRSSGLIATIDANGYQCEKISEVMPSLEPLGDKWRSFGWDVQEVDGHNINALLGAYENAKKQKSKPSMIIARTIKGKGFSLMEQEPLNWHFRVLTEGEHAQAMKELGGSNV